jgi:hypothetical protein
MNNAPPFHLAFPVRDLAKTRWFYGTVLGCREGRSAERWVDFDFFGHQISAHVKPEALHPNATNEVDDDDVPVRHFGVVLEWPAWEQLRDRLRAGGIEFLIEPHVRFEGEIGEQATLFVTDPSGNALEFKAFHDRQSLFAH